MKRILSLVILFSICLTYFYGCSNSNTPMAIGKKLEKNLTTLYNTVTNLDTIDNSYIANPDIYQLEDIKTNTDTILQIKKTIAQPNQDEAVKLNFENVDEIENINIETNSENTNESNNTNDNINENNELIEEDVDNNNQTDLTETENEILNIKSESESTNTIDSITTETVATEEQKVEVVFEEEIDSTKNLSDVIIIDEDGEGTMLNNQGEVIEDLNELDTETIDQIYNDTLTNNKMTTEEKNKVFEFLFENVRYTPRYVTEYNTNNAQVTLNNYLYKVQELYTMTADVVEANNVLHNKKESLLNIIENVKLSTTKMINGEITPNSQQLVALNNYAQDIKTTIKRLKDCNGQLNNEVNNISTTSSSYGLSKGVDIINSNYLKILNHIDVRITYFKSAMATLDQVSYILKETELNISYEDINLDNETKDKEFATEKIKSNIDTYNNTTKNNVSKNNENTTDFNNNLKNTNIDTLYGDNVNNHNTIDIINNDSELQNKTVDTNNIAINNTQNHNLPNKHIYNNAINGTYQNGIITQNNLNNGVNNGANGYNTGYHNGYGYVDYYNNNTINRTYNNVNTFGRNTLIDMINNGTVNNGINTLQLTPTNNKPIMVDTEISNANCNCAN